MKLSAVCISTIPALLLFLAGPVPADAAAPNLKTPAPVIYLEDNLDEKDGLGWCIDTVGRGLSDRLHAHSCKPRGGDVQFRFDAATGQIKSATFAGKCAELLAPAESGVKLGLLACDAESRLQQFDYNQENSEFRPRRERSLCLAVAPASRTAGPFMSRDLILGLCAVTDATFKRWIVKD